MTYTWHQATDQDAVYLLMGNKNQNLDIYKSPKPHGLCALKGMDSGPRQRNEGRECSDIQEGTSKDTENSECRPLVIMRGFSEGEP